jgi:hypothetical protein
MRNWNAQPRCSEAKFFRGCGFLGDVMFQSTLCPIAAGVADARIGVRNASRRKECHARLGETGFAVQQELVFVLAMMNVRRRAAVRHIVRFNDAYNSTRVVSMHTDGHGNAKNVGS